VPRPLTKEPKGATRTLPRSNTSRECTQRCTLQQGKAGGKQRAEALIERMMC
jgi:hypothetical protein